jgi:hypothetical protein
MYCFTAAESVPGLERGREIATLLCRFSLMEHAGREDLEFPGRDEIMIPMKFYSRLQSDRRIVLVVWIAIFIMKLSIGISHVLAARKEREAPSRSVPELPGYRGHDPEARRALDDCSRSLTRAIDTYQRNSQREHLLAAYGYLVAALTSLASIILELRSLAGEGNFFSRGPA